MDELMLRQSLRAALEYANKCPNHDDGHEGGTFWYIKQALDRVSPGDAEVWAETGEWSL